MSLDSKKVHRAKTLKELRSLEDASLLFGEEDGFFLEMQQKQKVLLEEEVLRLKKKGSLFAEIEILFLLYAEMMPEDVLEHIQNLKDLAECEEKEEVRLKALHLLEELEMVIVFPIAAEMMEKSIYSNFQSRLRLLNKREEWESFWASLSEKQKEVIAHFYKNL